VTDSTGVLPQATTPSDSGDTRTPDEVDKKDRGGGGGEGIYSGPSRASPPASSPGPCVAVEGGPRRVQLRINTNNTSVQVITSRTSIDETGGLNRLLLKEERGGLNRLL